MMNRSYVIKNTEGLKCHICGDVHGFLSRNCVTLELNEEEADWYNDLGEPVELGGSHAMVTVPFYSDVPSENSKSFTRSTLWNFGLAEGLLQ
jgi:hypothetical protein